VPYYAGPEQMFIRTLPAVDMHHNQLATEPPYAAVEVFGVPATEAVREALSDFELTVVEETASHFRAEVKRGKGSTLSRREGGRTRADGHG
jgi:hypothetical protein